MIPFVDLSRNKELNAEIKSACSRVIDSGWFVLGKELERFESEFAGYCGKEYGIGVGNGTDAITLSLQALKIGSGDEVITVPNTAIPTVSAIVDAGARPVFVDVGLDYLIDPIKIEEKITERTKAIIPVHLYGRPCNMIAIGDIAARHNLQIVEDCAQAHGAKYEEKKVPYTDTGCFSFYPSKNLGTLGDGGMVVTSSKDLADKLKLLRNYGQSDRYHAKIQGRNTRLDEMQAAILSTKLKHLDDFNEARKSIAEDYVSLLKGKVILPSADEKWEYSVNHLFVVRTDRRDGLMKHLKDEGINTAIHYPIPLHLQEAYKGLGYKEGDFPNAEKYAKEILSLPMFPELTREEIETVAREIKSF